MAQAERSITRDLLTLAAAVIVIIGMKLLASVIAPILAAMFLFVAFLPMLHWLVRKGVQPRLAKAIVIGTVVGSALLVTALIVIAVTRISADLPAHRALFRERLNTLAGDLSGLGISISGESFSTQFDLRMLVSISTSFLPGMISAIAGISVALIVFLYAIADADGIGRRLKVGIDANDNQMRDIVQVMAMMGEYIRIRAILGGIAALANLVLLLVLGVDYAVLWALVSFAMSFIPYVGYWVALVPPFLVAFIDGGWLPALIIFFGYWLINGTIDNLLSPRMLGRGVNIAPAVTVIAIVFWGFIFGPVGAILAMPLTVGFKVLLLERNPDSRWLALLVSASDDDSTSLEPAAQPGYAAHPGD